MKLTYDQKENAIKVEVKARTYQMLLTYVGNLDRFALSIVDIELPISGAKIVARFEKKESWKPGFFVYTVSLSSVSRHGFEILEGSNQFVGNWNRSNEEITDKLLDEWADLLNDVID